MTGPDLALVEHAAWGVREVEEAMEPARGQTCTRCGHWGHAWHFAQDGVCYRCLYFARGDGSDLKPEHRTLGT